MTSNFYSRNLASDQNYLPNHTTQLLKGEEAARKLQELLQNHENCKALVNQVTETFDDGLNARQDKSTIWLKCWLAYYMSKTDKIKAKEKNNPHFEFMMLSWVFEAVETAATELVDALLPNKEDYFQVNPQKENNQEQEANAKISDKMIKFKMKQGGFLEEFPKYIKQVLITGNAAGRIYMKKVDKTIFSRNINKAGIPSPTIETKTIEIPVFENIDIQDFVIYPLNTTMQDSNCVHRLVKPISSIQSNAYHPQTNPFGYMNVMKVKPDPSLTDQSGVSAQQNKGNKQAINNAAGIIDNSFMSSSNTEQAEILEFWGTIKIKDYVFENMCITVANRSVLLRVQPNPFGNLKPFIFTGYTPIPNQLYSIGLVEQVLGIWQSATTLHNLMLENVKLQVNGTYTFEKEKEPLLNPNMLRLRPNGIIPVKSHDSLRLLAQGSDISSAYNNLNFLKKEFELTTAISDIVRGGVPRSSGTTAKEIQYRGGQAKKQFVETANHLNSTTLVPIVQLYYEHLIRYGDSHEIAAVCDVDESQVNQLFNMPFDSYNVEITGINSYVIKNTEIDQLVNFIQMLGPTPAAKRLNWTNVAKLAARILAPSDSAKDLLLDDDALEILEQNEVIPLLQPPPIANEELLEEENQ